MSSRPGLEVRLSKGNPPSQRRDESDKKLMKGQRRRRCVQEVEASNSSATSSEDPCSHWTVLSPLGYRAAATNTWMSLLLGPATLRLTPVLRDRRPRAQDAWGRRPVRTGESGGRQKQSTSQLQLKNLHSSSESARGTESQGLAAHRAPYEGTAPLPSGSEVQEVQRSNKEAT